MRTFYDDRSTDYEQPNVLVTGATGLLGRWLVPELTARGARVIAPIRSAAARAPELAAWVDAHGGASDRLVVVEGDLDAADLGLDPENRARLASVRHVFHLGARFAWGLDVQEARRTNVEGSLRIVELAARLPKLERIVLVGGYRIGPRLDRDARVVQADPHAIARAGAYEASKHEAHRAAVERARELGVPISAVHPATVIGDSRTGESTQTVGLGETILALAEGRMPVRVGSPSTFVPVVTVDFVARVMAELANDPAANGLELTLLDPATPTLDGLIDRAATLLGVRAPRLRLPLGLVRLLPEAITRTPREALEFLDDARYPLEATDAWLAAHGLVHPEFETSYERWVRALVARSSPASTRRPSPRFSRGAPWPWPPHRRP